MFCYNCGRQNPEGAVFCTSCGVRLQPQQQTSQQQTSQQQAPQQQAPQYQAPRYQQPPQYGQVPYGRPPKKKHRALPWIIAGAVVAAAAIALVLVLVLGGRGGYSDPEEAAFEMYQAVMLRDFDTAVGSLHPDQVEGMGEENFNELKKEFREYSQELRRSHTTYDHFVIEYTEHTPEDGEWMEEELLTRFDTELEIDDVYNITVTCDCFIDGVKQENYRMGETIPVYKTGGRWYVWPEF